MACEARPIKMLRSPELDRIDDPRARHLVEEDVLGACEFSSRQAAAAIGVLVLVAVLTLPLPWLMPVWLVVAAWMISRIEGRMAARHVRGAMSRHGYPTCVRCGYDCRGIGAERCPECGRRLEGPLPARE